MYLTEWIFLFFNPGFNPIEVADMSEDLNFVFMKNQYKNIILAALTRQKN